MAMIMEGLVSDNATEKVIIVEKLLAASDGTGWMHEAFNPNSPNKFSRGWFCWPDALFAELVMSLTDKCPRPERGQYTVKEWTDPVVMEGSAFSKPIPPWQIAMSRGVAREREMAAMRDGGGDRGKPISINVPRNNNTLPKYIVDHPLGQSQNNKTL